MNIVRGRSLDVAKVHISGCCIPIPNVYMDKNLKKTGLKLRFRIDEGACRKHESKAKGFYHSNLGGE